MAPRDVFYLFPSAIVFFCMMLVIAIEVSAVVNKYYTFGSL